MLLILALYVEEKIMKTFKNSKWVLFCLLILGCVEENYAMNDKESSPNTTRTKENKENCDEKKSSGVITQGFKPKNIPREEKTEKENVEMNNNADEELKWDPIRKMFHFGPALPDRPINNEKPLQEDSTKVIYEIDLNK